MIATAKSLGLRYPSGQKIHVTKSSHESFIIHEILSPWFIVERINLLGLLGSACLWLRLVDPFESIEFPWLVSGKYVTN
jgi:hypothetical protein